MQSIISRLSDISPNYRPIPFWSWNDQLDAEELRRQIGWMHANGIGGFFMHARGGLKHPIFRTNGCRRLKSAAKKQKNLA